MESGNVGWPEAFGFTIGGNDPVVILEVQAGSFAQEVGILPGDQIIEVDSVNVQGLSRDEIRRIAAQSRKVPPSLGVISRVRTMEIPRPMTTTTTPRGVSDFGFTLRGDGPLFVRSVDLNGAARRAGIRSGDMMIEIEGENVQNASKEEAMELVRSAQKILHLVLMASGLEPLPRRVNARLRTPSDRYSKARIFYEQVRQSCYNVYMALTGQHTNTWGSLAMYEIHGLDWATDCDAGVTIMCLQNERGCALVCIFRYEN